MSDHIEFDFDQLTDHELGALIRHATVEMSDRLAGKKTRPPKEHKCKCKPGKRMTLVPPIKGESDA